MSLHDDFLRFEQKFDDLMERVRLLERLNPLNNSSIDEEPGLRVKEGRSIKFGDWGKIGADGGKIGVEGDMEMKDGSIGAGGTKIGNDGVISNDDNDLKIGSNTEFAGNATAKGALRGEQGVFAPYKTMGLVSLGSMLATVNDNSVDRDDALSGRVTTAQNRANAAHTLASNAASSGALSILSGKVNDIIDVLNAVEDQMTAYHPGKPLLPPRPPKG